MQCQKCNNELEVDSKFCAHCGATVSEKVLAKMKEDSPTSKAKVYIFKGIAFVIALFVFSIARMIFTAMSGSDKVAIGGILLFYGVYALLSGLFLKEKSSIKRGGWVLAIYIVGSIAFTYYYNNSSLGIDQQIMEMGKNTPQRIDDNLEFTSVKLDGNNVLMNYKLFNLSKNDIPSEKLEGLKNTIEAGLCKDESFAKVLEYGKNITASVYGNDNNLILDIHVSKGDCTKKSSISDNEVAPAAQPTTAADAAASIADAQPAAAADYFPSPNKNDSYIKPPEKVSTLVKISHGVIKDTKTNLMWQDNKDAKRNEKNWEEAVDYCENLSLAGFDDWRLPDINTLKGLSPQKNFLQNVDDSDYWSSTVPNITGYNNKMAWSVSFYNNGRAYYDWKANPKYVRCIRGN